MILSEPSKYMVPSFFHDRQSDLESYFKTHFLDEGGTFQAELTKDDQLEKVLTHFISSLKSGSLQITRRAILILSNHLEPEFAPLGLTSIHILGSHTKSGIAVDISFSWRTVEALVGFPYSIYASVKYAEYLAERIKEKLPKLLKNKTNLREVIYLAGNLHLVTNNHGHNIARKIVDDACE